MSVNSGVTANNSNGGQNYGLLSNVNSRPMPNALTPHINPSTGSGFGAGQRRGSRHSNNNSVGGANARPPQSNKSGGVS